MVDEEGAKVRWGCAGLCERCVGMAEKRKPLGKGAGKGKGRGQGGVRGGGGGCGKDWRRGGSRRDCGVVGGALGLKVMIRGLDRNLTAARRGYGGGLEPGCGPPAGRKGVA